MRLGALRRQLRLSVPGIHFPLPGSANLPRCWVDSAYETDSLISRNLRRQQVVHSGLGRQWLPENEVGPEPTFEQRRPEGLLRDCLESRLWEAAEASRRADEREAAAQMARDDLAREIAEERAVWEALDDAGCF